LKFKNDEFYNCQIILDNQETYFINANSMHNNQVDKWTGWTCDAGYNRISIDSNLNVYGGQCQNDYLGKLGSDWKLLTQPTICAKVSCNGCTDDLLAEKSSNQ
jgi:hypothetical protein